MFLKPKTRTQTFFLKGYFKDVRKQKQNLPLLMYPDVCERHQISTWKEIELWVHFVKGSCTEEIFYVWNFKVILLLFYSKSLHYWLTFKNESFGAGEVAQ